MMKLLLNFIEGYLRNRQSPCSSAANCNESYVKSTYNAFWFQGWLSNSIYLYDFFCTNYIAYFGIIFFIEFWSLNYSLIYFETVKFKKYMSCLLTFKQIALKLLFCFIFFYFHAYFPFWSWWTEQPYQTEESENVQAHVGIKKNELAKIHF